MTLPRVYRAEDSIAKGDGTYYFPLLVLTGEFRCPLAGEWFLSGAIPSGYLAKTTLNTPYHILRRAAPDERICPTCSRVLDPER